MPEDTEKKYEGWLEAFDHMNRLRYGPPPEEMEVSQVMNTFYEFLAIQMVATTIIQMLPEGRAEFITDLRKNWKKSLRRHVNEQVKKHADILLRTPDGRHLVNFIGDAENMRVAANKQLKAADERVEDLLKCVLKSIEEKEKEGN